MDKEHPLRYNEILRSSIDTEISDQLLENVLQTRMSIEEYQEDWYKVAIVHLSWDLMTSSHIQYIQTIIAKLRKEMHWKPFKLFVWVEADVCTQHRKNKKNINSEEERRFMFENIKWVDKAYIEFEWLSEQNNHARPAWIVKYLKPDIMISHEEHVPKSEQDLLKDNVKQAIWWEAVIINYWDEEKYLWMPSMREKFNRSTTNTLRQIFEMYYDNPKYNRFISSNE